ncbi:AMP-binding protein [Zhongshania aquimaris]|uniref:Long-chain-fatty-acid--CoA ligase n=1 Tax=Zhongshania aquimaris TaxID=2857107 RepID=A0ABS6VQH6_9GAMM|nr:AMP-binding protein [Zhongshania aquimaris]MBW2940000.1 AMP-binding protein [Zhongshania aquimaris]
MNDTNTVVNLLEHAFTTYPDKPAFTCLGKTLTYKELDSLSSQFAIFLQTQTDLKPGDRLAIQLPNLLQYPVAAFGAMRAGIVIVNTNPLYTPREMQHQFSDSGAKALVTLASQKAVLETVAKNTQIQTVILTDVGDLHSAIAAGANSQSMPKSGLLSEVGFRDALAAGANADFTAVALEPHSLALLQYTGGTTGVAKGAMLAHQNLVANARQCIAQSTAYFNEGAETYVAALPLYHIYAFTVQMLTLIFRGGHNILIPDPRNTDALVEAVKPYAFTGFPGISTLFASLCNNPSFQQLNFSALKSTSAGGMALSEKVATQWKALTGIEIAEGYGMTESSPVISSNPPGRIQSGTIGIPVPGTEVRIIDREGNTLPDGKAGELCVRGPQVMQGYWQRPEATAEVVSDDGWLRTGDIAIRQQDGYLKLVDRLKDIILVSGFNVYPNEIEEVASSYPDILECAAISVPDSQSGEAIKLFVVPTSNRFDADRLRDYLRTQLTPYKVPKHIALIDELPKSNVGKILRRELRD